MASLKRKELYDCDRCGSQFKKKKLKKQKGLWVCQSCYDDARENKSINMRLGTPRTAGTSEDFGDGSWGGYRWGLGWAAVTTPEIFTITAAGGITPSHSLKSETTRSVGLGISTTTTISFGNRYYMKVNGGGAIDITINPQISAGSQGDILTVEGTSDTDTVLLENGNGVELSGGVNYTFKNGSIMTLVYDAIKSKWVETSRN